MVTQRSSSAKPVGSTDQPIVFVVDDDASMRQALARLLQSVQLGVEVFASPQEFLQSERPDIPSCLVLDVRLPGLSGLDFQAELLKADVRMPIVFITGHGDIPMSVRAMKAGAVDSSPSHFAIRIFWMPLRLRSSAIKNGVNMRMR